MAFIRKRKIKWIGTVLVLGLLYLFSKNLVDARMEARKDTADIRYLPRASTLKFLYFGFEQAMADVAWIEAINYFGSELVRKNRNYQYLRSYCELIMHLDPLFKIFYEWAGTVFIYNALPIDEKAIISSTNYVNFGIRSFHQYRRYDLQTILKGAFNYALEAKNYLASVPYFEMAARIFPDQRDMFLVGASYAQVANDMERSNALKLEYLGNIAFEATNRDQLLYAIRILSSASFNLQNANIISSLRTKLETDEEIKKLVANRLKEQPLLRETTADQTTWVNNQKMERVLRVDFSKTWMPTELNVLLSL